MADTLNTVVLFRHNRKAPGILDFRAISTLTRIFQSPRHSGRQEQQGTNFPCIEGTRSVLDFFLNNKNNIYRLPPFCLARQLFKVLGAPA